MIMIRSIIRPDKSDDVMKKLLDAGYPAITKISVVGRGKQRGLKVGQVTYDEIPKELLLTVVPESEKETVLKTIMKSARSGSAGAFGDGKIFVSQVDEVYTISTGEKEA